MALAMSTGTPSRLAGTVAASASLALFPQCSRQVGLDDAGGDAVDGHARCQFLRHLAGELDDRRLGAVVPTDVGLGQRSRRRTTRSRCDRRGHASNCAKRAATTSPCAHWLTSTVRRALSASISINGPKYGLVDTLFTSTSRRPNRSSVAATAASAPAASAALVA